MISVGGTGKAITRARAAGSTDAEPSSERGSPAQEFQFTEPLIWRPAFAWGLRTKEVFAGTGRWTAAMQRAGIPVNESVELYADPVRPGGPCPDHDVTCPAVQDRLRQNRP